MFFSYHLASNYSLRWTLVFCTEMFFFCFPLRFLFSELSRNTFIPISFVYFIVKVQVAFEIEWREKTLFSYSSGDLYILPSSALKWTIFVLKLDFAFGFYCIFFVYGIFFRFLNVSVYSLIFFDFLRIIWMH